MGISHSDYPGFMNAIGIQKEPGPDTRTISSGDGNAIIHDG